MKYTRARFNYGAPVRVIEGIVEDAVYEWAFAHPDFRLRYMGSESRWIAEFQEEGDCPSFLEWLFDRFKAHGLKPTEILGPVDEVGGLHLFAAENKAGVSVERVDVDPTSLRQLVKFGNFSAKQWGTTFTLEIVR